MSLLFDKVENYLYIRICFSSAVLEALSLLKHSRIRSIGQPVLNNECKLMETTVYFWRDLNPDDQ
jgi:hypothetical protein